MPHGLQGSRTSSARAEPVQSPRGRSPPRGVRWLEVSDCVQLGPAHRVMAKVELNDTCHLSNGLRHHQIVTDSHRIVFVPHTTPCPTKLRRRPFYRAGLPLRLRWFVSFAPDQRWTLGSGSPQKHALLLARALGSMPAAGGPENDGNGLCLSIFGLRRSASAGLESASYLLHRLQGT